MKIIGTDNFARETVADTLICENVNEFYGKYIRDFLQEKFGGESALTYYRLVSDDYKLRRGMEEFV